MRKKGVPFPLVVVNSSYCPRTILPDVLQPRSMCRLAPTASWNLINSNPHLVSRANNLPIALFKYLPVSAPPYSGFLEQLGMARLLISVAARSDVTRYFGLLPFIQFINPQKVQQLKINVEPGHLESARRTEHYWVFVNREGLTSCCSLARIIGMVRLIQSNRCMTGGPQCPLVWIAFAQPRFLLLFSVR